MNVSIIVAMDELNGIGENGKIPWYLPADLKRFKRLTSGHHLIMGRKTYDSIGKPLPNRISLILSKENHFKPIANSEELVYIVPSLDEAFQIAQSHNENEVFIIGGGCIYHQSIKFVEKIYLTRVHSFFTCDTYFPKINYEEWDEIENQIFEPDLKHKISYSFITLVKKQGFS